MIIYAATIFVSSFLLFLVQPIVAKQILPWFGGSAAVWGTCLVFFQVALLGGYAYADISNRLLKPRTQSTIHMVLLLASLAALPVVAAAGWKPVGGEDPVWRILGLLLATVGLPFFVLSTTAPLIQSWFAREHADPVSAARVYRFFALSNLGAILGLLAYPFAIEMWFSTRAQAIGWSAGYALFAVLCTGSAWRARLLTEVAGADEVDPPVPLAGAGELSLEHPHDELSGQPLAAAFPAPPRAIDHGLWFALAALAAMLLLAVTNHITQDIASVPFMWVIPLALYLFTFVLCFEGRGGRGFYERKFWIWPALAAICLMALGIPAQGGLLSPAVAIPLYCSGLFLVCMFCHGELAAAKPAPRYLTRFYLALTLGGAAGGLFVGIAAPYLFTAYWELPLGLAALALMVLALNRQFFAGEKLRLTAAAPPLAALLSLGVVAYCAYDYSALLQENGMSVEVRAVRNFYGRLSVLEIRDPSEDMSATLRLKHGNTLHGGQFDYPPYRRILTTYYTETSGVGLALAHFRPGKQGAEGHTGDPLPRRIGAVGLGVGTIAGYGNYGDTFKFYEINPRVVDIAHDYFYFLNGSRAKIEIALGDARLALEREPPQQFDVLVIDAFYGDTIPVHLITREALAVYLKHIRPGGAVAFHVSNRYLNLAPVAKQLADEAGFEALLINDKSDDKSFKPFVMTSNWVIVTRDTSFAADPEVTKKLGAFKPIAGLKIWTDDFNNLFQILR